MATYTLAQRFRLAITVEELHAIATHHERLIAQHNAQPIRYNITWLIGYFAKYGVEIKPDTHKGKKGKYCIVSMTVSSNRHRLAMITSLARVLIASNKTHRPIHMQSSHGEYIIGTFDAGIYSETIVS